MARQHQDNGITLKGAWLWFLGGALVVAIALAVWILGDSRLVVGHVTELVQCPEDGGWTARVATPLGAREVFLRGERKPDPFVGRWVLCRVGPRGHERARTTRQAFVLPLPYRVPFLSDGPAWSDSLVRMLARWRGLAAMLGAMLLLAHPYWVRVAGGAACGLFLGLVLWHLAALGAIGGLLSPLDPAAHEVTFALGVGLGFLLSGGEGPAGEFARRLGIMAALLSFDAPIAAYFGIPSPVIVAVAVAASLFLPVIGIGLLSGFFLSVGLGAVGPVRWVILAITIVVLWFVVASRKARCRRDAGRAGGADRASRLADSPDPIEEFAR